MNKYTCNNKYLIELFSFKDTCYQLKIYVLLGKTKAQMTVQTTNIIYFVWKKICKKDTNVTLFHTI